MFRHSSIDSLVLSTVILKSNFNLWFLIVPILIKIYIMITMESKIKTLSISLRSSMENAL